MLFFELSIENIEKKKNYNKTIISTKLLSSATVFKINNNTKCFLRTKSAY